MNQNQLKPIKIERNGANGLFITWSNGTKLELKSEDLRKNCPCAKCKDMRGDVSHSKPLTSKPSLLKILDHSKEEEIKLVEVSSVGNYAINLIWADSHSTGIYTFELLRNLCNL